MAILTFLVVSLMIANWDTSAPVPAVVGMQTRGGGGMGILSTPSKSRMCLLLENTMPMPFAQSMGLPPPTTRMLSHLQSVKSFAPAITSVSRGLGETSEKRVWFISSSSRLRITSCTQPALFTSGLVTTSEWRAPRFFAYRPARSLAFSPIINSGATNFRSSNLDFSIGS